MNSLFEAAGVYGHLTLNEKRYVKEWENNVLPYVLEFQYQLNEAEMTRDQVLDLFNRIEDNVSGKFSNRTTVGKAIDVIKLPNTILDKIGSLAEKSRPVKAFDSAFDNVKAKFRNSMSGNNVLISVVDGMGNFAKKHPVAQGFVIAILSLSSAVAIGPMAVPIVGAILRFGNEILKGEKFSKAIGRAVKTGMLGFMAGWGIQELTDMFASAAPEFKEVEGVDFLNKWSTSFYSNGTTVFSLESLIPNSLQPKIDKLVDEMIDAATNGETEKATEIFSNLESTLDSPEWRDMLKQIGDTNNELYSSAMEQWTKTKELIKSISDSAQSIISASIAGSTGGKKDDVSEDINQNTDLQKSFKVEILTTDGHKEVMDVDAKTEREALRKAILAAQKQDHESVTATIITEDKKSIFEAAGSFAKFANWAKGLTNKVTVSKLMSAWKKAGSPTDSDEIAKILKSNGINRKVLDDYINGNPSVSKKKKGKKQQTNLDTEVVFNTGNAEFDQKLTQLLKTKGKAAVVAALKSYKKSLDGGDPSKTRQPDPYQDFKYELRNLAGIPPKKRLPANAEIKFRAEFESDIKKMAAGDIESGLYAGNQLVKYARAGYDVNDEMVKWLGLAKANNRNLKETVSVEGFLPVPEYRDFTMILKENGLDWKDIGVRVRLDASVKDGVFVSKVME